MTVTPETARWERSPRPGRAATSGRGSPGPGAARPARRDLVRRRLPDPETFPRERISSLLQEFAAAGELSAFQYAPTRGLAGRWTRSRTGSSAAGPPAGRGRAADHERRDRGARADRQVVPRPRRRRRRRGPHLPGRDPGVPELRGDARRRPARRARPRSTSWSGSSRRGCARSSSTRSPTTRTRRASASRPSGAAPLVELARRYGFLIVEDVAYRELGFTDETLPSLWSLAPTSSSRRGRPRRRSAPASGSAGPSARPRSPPGSSRPSSSPTSARARSGSGSSRSRSGAAGSTSS